MAQAVPPRDTKNFDSLKKQARALSCFGSLVRFVIIATIPGALAVVIYICTVGVVWPWTVEPIKTWIATNVVKAPDSSVDVPESTARENADGTPQAPPPEDKEPEAAALQAKVDQAADLTAKIVAARDQLDASTRDRDKLERKLKSAESWMPLAETQVNRALADFNSATLDYQARAQNGVARGLDDALRRLQIDIDRAKRHQDEAAANYVAKKAAVDAAQKKLDDYAKTLEKQRAELSNLCKKAKEMTEQTNATH